MWLGRLRNVEGGAVVTTLGIHLNIPIRHSGDLPSGSHSMEGFKNSDLYHKSNLLKQQADYLLTIQLDDGSVKLYSWERFFIEEYLDDEQQVTKIQLVGSSGMLKYLKGIDLGYLGYPTAV